MDRHVYAWHADGTAVAGWPALVVDRSKVAAIDPATHAVTFKPDSAANDDQGAIVDTPAVGDLTGDGEPEVVVGTNESYEETINAGSYNEAEYAPLGAALSPGNGRLYALKPTGLADNLALTNDGYVAGWPFKVGILQRGLLPLVGEGVTGSPIIGAVPCNGVTSSVRVGTVPAAGLAYLVNPDGQSCYGRTNGKDIALPSSGGLAADPVFLAAVGHPAFGTLAGQPSFLAPAAGVLRASDVVLPEYQGGRDYLAAWNTGTGQIAQGWPVAVNDLQFLTGPSVADLGGLPGQEVVGGSANLDLYGVTGLGAPIDSTWPKLTGDWLVMNPVLGTWGDGANKVLVTGTRSGRLLAYETAGGSCAAADWPQFHHDPANSGDARRDAVSPGFPTEIAADDTKVTFKAPGDDLLCGTATRYEASVDDGPFTTVGAAPQAAGTAESITLAGKKISVRAVDEQGNVGRAATVTRSTSGGGTGTARRRPRRRPLHPPATPTPTPTAPTAGPIVCAALPSVTITSAKANRRRAKIRGTAGPLCAKVKRVEVAISRRIEGACRHVRRNGRLAKVRRCRDAIYVRAKGVAKWRSKRKLRVAPGRYAVRVRAVTAAGPGRVTRVRINVK